MQCGIKRVRQPQRMAMTATVALSRYCRMALQTQSIFYGMAGSIAKTTIATSTTIVASTTIAASTALTAPVAAKRYARLVEAAQWWRIPTRNGAIAGRSFCNSTDAQLRAIQCRKFSSKNESYSSRFRTIGSHTLGPRPYQRKSNAKSSSSSFKTSDNRETGFLELLSEWVVQLRRSLQRLLPFGSTQQVQGYQALRERIQRLDSDMQYHDYHTLRWTAGLSVVAVAVLYTYWVEIKQWFGSTSADITSSTLRDTNVQREAQNLAQGVVYELLNDANALRLTSEFLNQLLEREQSRTAVLDLLAHVAARPETQTMFQDLFVRILTQPEFVAQASLFVQEILLRESTQLALRTLFKNLFADPAYQEYTAQFFQSVLETQTFRDATTQLSSDNVEWILQNEDISKHAVAWINAVLAEPALQYKAGDAIWGALTSTFVPGFLGGGRPSVTATNKKNSIVNIDEAMANLARQNTKTATGNEKGKDSNEGCEQTQAAGETEKAEVNVAENKTTSDEAQSANEEKRPEKSASPPAAPEPVERAENTPQETSAVPSSLATASSESSSSPASSPTAQMPSEQKS